MSRDSITDETSIIAKLTANDCDTISWLQRIGFVEIGADGVWHPTALARSAIAGQSQPSCQTEAGRVIPEGANSIRSSSLAEFPTYMGRIGEYGTGARTMRAPGNVIPLNRRPYIAWSRG